MPLFNTAVGGDSFLRPTLGVEIECLIIQDLSRTPEEHKSSLRQARSLVHEALCQRMNGICATCGNSHLFSLPLNPVVDIYQHNKNPSKYSKWSVVADVSLGLTIDQKMSLPKPEHSTRAHAMEIVSRIMGSDSNLPTTVDDGRTDHIHEITYQEEIRSVLHALTDYFNRPESPHSAAYRLTVNQSCGLHVHIGNGNRFFPLTTVKNLLAISVANEKQIDSMHSRSRIDGRTLQTGPMTSVTSPFESKAYNIPWSARFTSLENAIRYDEGESFLQHPGHFWRKRLDLEAAAFTNDLESRLILIAEAPTLPQLKYLQGEERPTVNLQNLAPFDAQGWEKSDANTDANTDARKKTTIEFRQHAGTLHPEEVIAWIDFLLHLTRYAHKHTEEHVQKLARQVGEDQDISELLDVLGFDSDDKTYVHYQRVTQPDQGGGSNWARSYWEHETCLADAFSESDRLRQVWLHCIRDCATDRSLEAVKRRIEAKQQASCYG
ncbi:hypothetical protein HII31_04074 [Pseudocercospora fuligena]|uniref:Amidoligase enzyme n=1 Tax=Pseudocercospora fuligena TaxID=685502 RepID=A0A8H6RNU9_9PEZI|nr:hypothetical protein HII31_04074 [Pseudocercospora fuligena]